MKAKHVFILVSALFLLLSTPQTFSQNKKGKETVTFQVEEMNCKDCQNKIEKNIGFEKGVTDIQCDLDKKTVKVTYKSKKTDPDKLSRGFEKIGYSVQIMESKETKAK